MQESRREPENMIQKQDFRVRNRIHNVHIRTDSGKKWDWLMPYETL